VDLPFKLPPGLELVTDLTPAAWIDERLMRRPGPGVRVGDVVPTGFEAYARIFHPVRLGSPQVATRWSTIAAHTGRTVHPEMQIEHVSVPLDLDRASEYPFERLTEVEAATLAQILRRFTSTPEVCWFAVWDGYGLFGRGVTIFGSRSDEDPAVTEDRQRLEYERVRWVREVVDRIPTFDTHDGHRSYHLFRGPLEAAPLGINGIEQPPNLWWPDDRAWCVATEIDGFSTYVGGPESCIVAVVEDERFEALRSDVSNRFDIHSDRVNPPPPWLWPDPS
jgi:hypothetical protein